MYAAIAKLVQPVAKQEPSLKEALAVLKKNGFCITEVQVSHGDSHYGMIGAGYKAPMLQSQVYSGSFKLYATGGNSHVGDVAHQIWDALGGH